MSQLNSTEAQLEKTGKFTPELQQQLNDVSILVLSHLYAQPRVMLPLSGHLLVCHVSILAAPDSVGPTAFDKAPTVGFPSWVILT